MPKGLNIVIVILGFCLGAFVTASYASASSKIDHSHDLSQLKNVSDSCAIPSSAYVHVVLWIYDYSTFKQLNLTVKQKELIRDLVRGRLKPEWSIDIRHLRRMSHLVFSKKLDENAVKSELKFDLERRIDEYMWLARVNNEIYNLLTPEQKRKLDQLQEDKINCLDKTLHDE